MANRQKGEATFEIDGKTYKLVLDMLAWAWAQDALSKGASVPAIELLTARINAKHYMTIIAVFGGSMQCHHEKEVTDLRTAMVILEKSKGKAAEALTQAIERSAPDAKDLEELGVSANPPAAQDSSKKANDGIGETSASKPAVPA
jgi:hypothetical protein